MDDRLTYDEALTELDKVAADIQSRDKVIRRAHRAHVPKAEIARRLGIGRPTVIKVIAEADRANEEGDLPVSRAAAPNRIIVAGDWHGNTSWALDVISRAEKLLAGEEHRVILHLGDFGIWPGDDGHEYICDVALALAQADAGLWFVDGNHEDHDQLRHDLGSGLAIPMGPGLYGDTIRWLPRGHRWEWHGRTWLALGGAASVDRAVRVKGNLGWWPEEEITDVQEARVVAGGPADVMVTHDCPAGVVHSFGPRPREWAEADLARSERHAQRLQRVVDAVQPSHLAHGHLHMAYQRVCDFGYGPVEVTGLDRDGGRGPNWAVLDVKSMTWEVP